MSSGEMRKLMKLVEGTIHGHSDTVALTRDGWTYDEALKRWTKPNCPFQIDCNHLESVFVYDMEAEDPSDPVGYFDAAVQALGSIEQEMADRQPAVAEESVTEEAEAENSDD